jgi:hypothetical protein
MVTELSEIGFENLFQYFVCYKQRQSIFCDFEIFTPTSSYLLLELIRNYSNVIRTNQINQKCV